MSGTTIAVLPQLGARDFFIDTATRRSDLFRVVDALPPAGEPALLVAPAIYGRMVEMVTGLLRDPAILAALRARAMILFDHSMEGPGLPLNILRPLHEALAAAGVPPGRIGYLTQNHQFAADYAQWAQDTGLGEEPGARLVILHHHFHVGVVARMAGQAAAAGALALPPASAIAGRPFRYLCLNNKFKDVRAIVLGHLLRTGLLAEGAVSFRETGDEEPPGRQRVLAAARQAFPRFAADLDAFEAFAPRLPLILDETDQFRRLVFGDTGGLVARASLTLVTESEMSLRNVMRLTEKTMKPFAAGQLALVAGNAGTLGLLRELGFATFAPLVDESYDRIAQPEARLQAVLAEFDRLATMPASEFERLLEDVRPALEHNLRHAGMTLPARIAAMEDALALALRRLLGAGPA